MPKRGVREGFLDHIADLRGPLTWVLLIVGGAAGSIVTYLQSWVPGILTLTSASGVIMGFQLWAGTRSLSAPWRFPRLFGAPIVFLTTAIETGRARRWRRTVASALAKPDLSPSAKLEIVDLLCGNHEPAAVVDMLPWATNRQVPAEVRLAIAAIAARGDVTEGVRVLRSLAEGGGAPCHIRFDAAEELLLYDEFTAERCLEELARSADTPNLLRFEAAAVLSERSYRGLNGQQGPEILGLLVGDNSAGAWVRIEACKLLRLHGIKRYQRALWSLANDSRLSAAQRLSCAKWLADVDLEAGERGWTALVHDPRLPFWARIDAATRLGQITEESGAFALRALLKDPAIDDRTRFDVVKKLTLLDLSQVCACMADCLCDT